MIISINIDVTKIPRDKIKTVTKKNGETGKYLDLIVITATTPDKFGNDARVQLGQSKEERQVQTPIVFIGNGKVLARDKVASGSQQPGAPQRDPSFNINDHEVPF